MFAPLVAEDIAGGATGGTISRPAELMPIIPVAADAPPCRWRHPRHGEPVATWAYRDADGELVGYAARVEYLQDGERKKDVYPLTYCRVQTGRGAYDAWRAQTVPALRPLYLLPELIASPDLPVIITEGEKKAGAISGLFPGHCGTTSMGGARAAKLSNWGPLNERSVIIWPDHDEAGRCYAEDVAVLATAAGATSVAIVEVPEDWPESWDLADPLPDGINIETIADLVRRARCWTRLPPESSLADACGPVPSYVSFGSYCMGRKGLLLETDGDLVQHRFLLVAPRQPAKFRDEVTDRAAMMPLIFVSGDVGGHVSAEALGLVPVGARRVAGPPLAPAWFRGRHVHEPLAVPVGRKGQVRVEHREVA
jgi:hypothetical protein